MFRLKNNRRNEYQPVQYETDGGAEHKQGQGANQNAVLGTRQRYQSANRQHNQNGKYWFYYSHDIQPDQVLYRHST